MRHKLVIALSILAIFTTGIVCAEIYHNAQVQKRAEQAKVNVEKAIVELKRKEAIRFQQQKLDDECKKSESAYQQLTPAQKAKTAAPDCRIQLLQ